MLVSKIRVYEKAVDQRESRLRAYTDVVGDTATRKVRLDDARILIGEIEEFASIHGLRKFLDDIGKPTSSAEIPQPRRFCGQPRSEDDQRRDPVAQRRD